MLRIAAVLTGRMFVTVTMLRAGYRIDHSAVVAASCHLQLLLPVEIWEGLSCLRDIVLEELRTEVDKRIRICFPASTVASLACNRMLNINLNYANTVELAVLRIT